jgi:dTDP-4-dehydrorhamnose reductase
LETIPLRIFVTGGSGLLGAELVRLTSQAGHDVLSGYGMHFPLAGSPVHLDMTKLNDVRQAILKTRPDIIIHTAAVSDVEVCEQKPNLANVVNGEVTGKIGEIATTLGSYVIYVSTDYVFDGATGSYDEDDKPNPINHYGRSKLLGEELLKKTGARYCVTRASVIYGWGRGHRPNFATWVLGKLKSNQPLEVIDDQFASPTLNSNLAEMILESTNKRLEGIIHLAGATRIDRYNFAKKIAETFHYDPNLIEPVKSERTGWKAKRPADSSLNVEKAERLLSRPPLELSEALRQFKKSETK